jgi:hypothetical protein
MGVDLSRFLKRAGMVALGVASEALPGGGLARELIDGVLGEEPASSDAEVIRRLEGDPEAILKLRELERQHEGRLIALSIDSKRADAERERARLADVGSARSRDVAVHGSGRINWRAHVMLALAFAAVVVIAVILGTGRIDAGSATAGFLYSVGGMFAKN